MKKLILNIIFINCLLWAINGYSQIKVISNGNVGIGPINPPLNSLHVWGFDQKFNWNAKEILFRPNNGGSDIGSNLGKISFWHPTGSGWWNTVEAGHYSTISDESLKKDIVDISNSLDAIKSLLPKKYKFKADSLYGSKFFYGFLSQDVQQIIPELVDSSKGMLTLNYDGIIPFLVGAIKEQAAQIEALQNALDPSGARQANPENNTRADSMQREIQNLREQIKYIQENCCQSPSNNSNESSTNDQIKNAIANNGSTVINNSNEGILLQNVPNPFDNTTTIKFSIPEKYEGKFFIKIYTIIGEERMSYSVNKSDKQIMVSSGNLPSGIYLYALIANNDVLGIKQMVISK